jgi:hypothetical protein
VWDQEKIISRFGLQIGKKHHLNLWSRQTNNPMDIPDVALLLAVYFLRFENSNNQTVFE